MKVESLIGDYFGVKQFLTYMGVYAELHGPCHGNLLIVEYETSWTKWYWMFNYINTIYVMWESQK
jgi:hypothetical protein